MAVRSADDLTRAVLAEVQRTSDARLRRILASAVEHLHGFVRDTELTEAEFRQLCGLVAQAGQLTTASHNEVVLAAGSLGVSALVCLLNNGQGDGATTANLMGPFWREGSPATPDGGSIVRSPTPGLPVFVTAWFRDPDGQPVAGARVDVWQASGEGYYENQDPQQADMNLRGTFTTDAQGRIRLRTVKPSGYPVPVGGPVGRLLRAQGRHNLRPAHIHFLAHKPGYKTQFSQLYSGDDPHLDSDVQFGVTEALVGHYVLHENDPAPAPDVQGPWYALEHSFVLVPGEATLPPPPITAKTQGERPALVVLPPSTRGPTP
ncbi:MULTISPECIES: dioxygenase [Ramlibacter]|uniref:Catechol 1,2-dioxygenase n=1 Tax=Ramlibacter pinisoli TaxID=2682844 RepID=A0A6N8IT82_9BURK|nr:MULTISPECIES: dioxygenase [Ramlibacter]MBA2965119.1 catechol 1,2-dioxygenase [Ramlibacter sp. CGMCC 1.13660]MVQ30084.1 catechol 1,2-dioxygenase [Ramlibacter pinisoli]